MFDEVVRKYGVVILFGALLFSIIFMDNGLYDYIESKVEITRLDKEITKLRQENSSLMNRLETVQKDDRYLEELVRKKYGLLREGERLYRIER